MAWDDVSRWQAADLAAAFKMGDPVQMIDVRELTWRESDSRIRGAIRVDPMEFAKEVPGLPAGKELVFYCDRAGEATSMKIALWAFDNGHSRVGVLVGGWQGWQDAGYAVVPKE